MHLHFARTHSTGLPDNNPRWTLSVKYNIFHLTLDVLSFFKVHEYTFIFLSFLNIVMVNLVDILLVKGKVSLIPYDQYHDIWRASDATGQRIENHDIFLIFSE